MNENIKWYVVKVQYNREKTVSAKFIKEAESGDLMNVVGRVLVPLEKTYSLKEGKKVVKEVVMYPGYIYVETLSLEKLKEFIKYCKGVSGLLSDRNGNPEALTEIEINRMIGVQEELSISNEETNKYIQGQEVRVIEGPFNTFTGIVESIKDDKLKVSISIFGRKTMVDLNSNQVERA